MAAPLKAEATAIETETAQALLGGGGNAVATIVEARLEQRLRNVGDRQGGGDSGNSDSDGGDAGFSWQR